MYFAMKQAICVKFYPQEVLPLRFYHTNAIPVFKLGPDTSPSSDIREK